MGGALLNIYDGFVVLVLFYFALFDLLGARARCSGSVLGRCRRQRAAQHAIATFSVRRASPLLSFARRVLCGACGALDERGLCGALDER